MHKYLMLISQQKGGKIVETMHADVRVNWFNFWVSKNIALTRKIKIINVLSC